MVKPSKQFLLLMSTWKSSLLNKPEHCKQKHLPHCHKGKLTTFTCKIFDINESNMCCIAAATVVHNLTMKNSNKFWADSKEAMKLKNAYYSKKLLHDSSTLAKPKSLPRKFVFNNAITQFIPQNIQVTRSSTAWPLHSKCWCVVTLQNSKASG